MQSRTSRPMGPVRTGVTATVKWFNATKGFGFVAFTDGTPDAFLHISVIERVGLRDVQPGTTLVCDVEVGPKGPQIADIQSIDASTAEAGGAAGFGGGRADGGFGGGGGGDETVEGVVKFFSPDKGFGFVTPDAGGKDVFVGVGALQRSGLDLLDSGQRVRLHTRMGKKGPMAQQVEVL
ncbi:cold-shock DNA-binding protein family [Caenispirillum bisanense]|uniref:Cold-shock DNA-binding protein family n=2 Tax=Caenispirillum bisanense TaxID=414052 RepID=A0A286GGW0_9PROT|nr:cold-shock DNA-binding protein family [Caenispirillum bisanense]